MKYLPSILVLLFLSALSCNQRNANDLSDSVDSLLNEAYTMGIFSGHMIISKDGKMVYYKPFGHADWNAERAINKNTLFNIGSLNKQFTEEIIHQLVAENKLSYTDKLSQYLNFLPAETGNKITIQQLLDMRAGFGDYLQNPLYDEIRFTDYSLSQLVDIIQEEPLLYEPGSRQVYSNSGYVILGAVIEKITDLSYKNNIKERIVKPLGLEKMYYTKSEKLKQMNRAYGTEIDFDGNKTSLDNPYNSTPAGGFYASIGNLLKFAEAKRISALPSAKEYGVGMFAGGTPVWNSIIYYNQQSGYCFVIMANVGGIGDDLAPRIISILNKEPYPPLELPYKQTLFRLINEKGIEYVKTNVENQAAQARLPYDDQFLNYFGYEFLFAGKGEIAIQLFKINTELFPEVLNTFDSLAEGYLMTGDTLNALKYYNLVLQKNPSNKLVEETIAKLAK